MVVSSATPRPVVRLRSNSCDWAGVEVLQLPDVERQDRKPDDLAEQAELELDPVDPPGRAHAGHACAFEQDVERRAAASRAAGRSSARQYSSAHATARSRRRRRTRHLRQRRCATDRSPLALQLARARHRTTAWTRDEHDDDDQRDAGGVGAQQQAPHTAHAQQPRGKQQHAAQRQPLQPQWFHRGGALCWRCGARQRSPGLQLHVRQEFSGPRVSFMQTAQPMQPLR